MSILVLADLHEGQLASATAHVVAAAQAIGGDIDVLSLVKASRPPLTRQPTRRRKVRVADNAVYAISWPSPWVRCW